MGISNINVQYLYETYQQITVVKSNKNIEEKYKRIDTNITKIYPLIFQIPSLMGIPKIYESVAIISTLDIRYFFTSKSF